jgi:hypothetical protein
VSARYVLEAIAVIVVAVVAVQLAVAVFDLDAGLVARLIAVVFLLGAYFLARPWKPPAD